MRLDKDAVTSGNAARTSMRPPTPYHVSATPPPVTATISSPQQTVTRDNEPVELEAKGRHDPCVLPRAAPMVESVVLLVLADHWLLQRTVDVLPPR